MNAQSWYSHIGQASTMPAVSATFSRSMNWSKGAVASNLHWPLAMSARADAGNAQYGWRSHSPRLSSPNIGCEYQAKPNAVVSNDHRQRDQQPRPQLGEMRDERHGRVGIGAAAAGSRIEPSE